jgi:hypothetical protein
MLMATTKAAASTASAQLSAENRLSPLVSFPRTETTTS